MINMLTSSIIPLRFRIDETYLRDKIVSVSHFAYEQACKDFMANMERLVSRNHPVSTPYSRLNTVMTALMPALAHPFVYPERQLLVVGEDVKRRPTAAQISDVVRQWGKQWGDQSFGSVVEGSGHDAYRRFLDRLDQPVQQWQDFDAADLFLKLSEGAQTGFRAIPSLLASLLAGRESTIHGRTVKWHLAQDGDYGLAAISQPFWVEYQEKDLYTQTLKTKKGTFSYKLEFRLQTQVGSSRPWLHLYVRCSRYVDEELRKKNWQRDVSVKMGVDQARVNGWPCSPTLVTLPVAGSKTNPRWDEQLVPLLAAMKARHLIEPLELFQNPIKYRTSTPQSQHDQYFVLHTEGFKPPHKVKTGFDFAEIHEVARSVSELLGLELSAGQTLTVDQSASFRNLADLPLSMYNLDELRRKVVVSRRGQPRKKRSEAEKQQVKEEAKRQNRLERQRIVLEALRRAAHHQPIFIYLCWHHTSIIKYWRQELYRILFYEEGDPWPEDITLVIPPQAIPFDLLEPLDTGTVNPAERYQTGRTWQERREFEEKWEKQMSQAFAAKTQAWERYLQRICGNRSGYGLALIELEKLGEKFHKDQSIKGAVRRACNVLGLASQMIYPLIPRPKPLPNKGEIIDESQGRLRNAVADLLYRQTGLIYERPKSLYAKAGLPLELTEQLHVVGLYRVSRQKPRVNYALAICLRPDGTYWALLPQQPERWLPLHEASRMIGELFFYKKAETINLPKEELASFAAHVFTSMKDVPTLVLFEAADWRNRGLFPQFANSEVAPKMQNQLDFRQIKPFERLYTPEDLPHLRIIRLRPIGTVGETPQYVPVLEEEDQPIAESDFEQSEEDDFTVQKDFEHLTGIVDTQAESPFFHYLSIGRRPKTVADGQKAQQPHYKLDDGGGIAFKHQTIVEFVPFFLQTGDDAQTWCHVAHFMRFSPGWAGGNIILSYPLHLAKDMLEDQFCILESSLDAEEE
jgi:hypothetical protein